MHNTEQLRTALADRYEIERRIGQGGMATVYLARDLKHSRRVALKVLNPDLGAVLGVERFLSEIQVTANLQHPNLLPLFDSGASDGLLYYVMPYIEGESLRAQLQREKQLPVDDAIRLATAIASALDYAHRHGVIHRDLKPENILLHDGQPLVADFGIALAVSNAGGNRITQTGLSLGTPQYMSPEQATGDRAIDARSDIYSLGAVVYEMLTGEPPHTGNTSQAVIARVLTEKPRSIRATRSSVPSHVEAAIEHALEKLAPDRFASAKEFSEALTGARAVTTASLRHVEAPADAPRAALSRRPAARELVAWGLVLALAGIAATLGVRSRRPERVPVPVEFDVQVPESLSVAFVGSAASLALSRDGSLLVFQATKPGSPPTLYMRRLEDKVVQEIRGTADARAPILSPDGTELLFSPVNGEAIRQIAVRGGTARTFADSAAGNGQASWGDAGQIMYTIGGSLFVVGQEGGTPRLVARPDTSRGHAQYGFPNILPRGRAALITIWSRTTVLDSATLGIATIPDGQVSELGVRGTYPRYAAGHVFFATSDGWLFALPFSVGSMRVTGAAIPVVEGVEVGSGGAAAFGVADNGTVAYLGGLTGAAGGRELVAVSRAGVERAIDVRPGWYQGPRISPDGRMVAMAAFTAAGSAGQGGPNPDVWRLDLRSNVLTRVTTDSASFRPAWSPDGERIAYIRANGDSVVRWRPLYATGDPTVLARVTSGLVFEVHMGRSRPWAALRIAQGASNSNDVLLARLDSATPARPFLGAPYQETTPRISPDGRLLAYVTNKTGANEVYVRAIAGDGAELQVSSEGGTGPVWAPTGLELFYRSPTDVMSVQLVDRPRLDIARRVRLFRDAYLLHPFNGNYDVFPDGKEFLFLRSRSGDRAQPITVRVNWRPRASPAATP